MFDALKNVHLFICLDERVSPGPVLQCLDFFRVENWQDEYIVVCDKSWSHIVSDEHAAIFVDREDYYTKTDSDSRMVNVDNLNRLLEELDDLAITQVTQIGELRWARWFKAYLDGLNLRSFNTIDINNQQKNSLNLVNQLFQTLKLDASLVDCSRSKNPEIYIDPYNKGVFDPIFLKIFDPNHKRFVPPWMSIVVQKKDVAFFEKLGLGSFLIDFEESQSRLFNQAVVCFSDDSFFAQQSRSYNVAVVGEDSEKSLYVSGDVAIHFDIDLDLTELVNILNYWKSNRLRELAFQWFNMGIHIDIVEIHDNFLFRRDLLNYSIDLSNGTMILREFTENSNPSIRQLIGRLRKNHNNDVYSVAFSVKFLRLITERMLAAASCGERLFQRLGSDYHRIIIGESLVESMINSSEERNLANIDIQKQLKNFLKFLIQIDHQNDQLGRRLQSQES